MKNASGVKGKGMILALTVTRLDLLPVQYAMEKGNSLTFS